MYIVSWEKQRKAQPSSFDKIHQIPYCYAIVPHLIWILMKLGIPPVNGREKVPGVWFALRAQAQAQAPSRNNSLATYATSLDNYLLLLSHTLQLSLHALHI